MSLFLSIYIYFCRQSIYLSLLARVSAVNKILPIVNKMPKYGYFSHNSLNISDIF